MTSEDHDMLIGLSWRYAALVGILAHPERAVAPEILVSDRVLHSDLVGTAEGSPVFDCEEGIRFMMQESGQPEHYCRAVLFEQWPNQACSECGAPSQTQAAGSKTSDEKHYVDFKCVSCDYRESRFVDCEDKYCEWCARLSAGL